MTAVASVAATGPGAQGGSPTERAPLGAAIAVSALMAIGALAALIALTLLVVHRTATYAVLGDLVNQQNQSAKTGLYLATLLIVLPLSALAGPRLADRIAGGSSGAALPGLVAVSVAGFALTVTLVKTLPLGAGVGVLLGGVCVWTVLETLLVFRATRPAPWPAALRVAGALRPAAFLAALLLLPSLLCFTQLGSLSGVGLTAGALGAAAALALHERGRAPVLAVRAGVTLECVLVVVLLLAVPDLVIFHTAPGPPNLFALPGIVQSQHDFFLGPVNQLLSHGALLVNAPGSQYGVGDLYLLAAWFHVVPIGYGSFGLLDGILSSLFYLGGYAVLRLVGLSRVAAAGTLLLALLTLVYRLQFPLGVLPEMGPLRFGMPMVLVVSFVVAARWPAWRRSSWAVALGAVAVASLWAVETFVYILFVLVALVAAQAWLLPAGERTGWLLRRSIQVIAAIVLAQLAFALITLAGSGQLPDWGQYFVYVQSFLLGGKAGQVTYGFASWSPALPMAAGLMISALALVLLVRRRAESARAAPALFLALSGTTAYATALFSYIDNRSSTYLLPYLGLPMVLLGAMWPHWILKVEPAALLVRRLALVLGAALGTLLLAAAWPMIGEHFRNSALARARPGGGLPAALHRLVHPPAIDPRSPEGVRLLQHYIPGPRPVVLLADFPDLAIELLMRRGAADGLSIGDTGMDSYVPSNWTGRIGTEIDALAPGSLILSDAATLRLARTVGATPGLDPLNRPLELGGNQMEWILQRLGRRFRLVRTPARSADFVVLRLVAR